MNQPEPAVLDESVLDDLAASVGGDRAFVVQLIETYLADSDTQRGAIEAAIAAGDAAALVRPAHTLKSSSATLGAHRVAARARALEMSAREDRVDAGTRADADQLPAECDEAESALRAWMAEAPGS